MNQSRRDFILKSGVIGLTSGALVQLGCGGGGTDTSSGSLRYGSNDLPIMAYGAVPTARTTTGTFSTNANITLAGVATVLGGKSTMPPGSIVSIAASLDIAKSVTFIATVPTDIVSRLIYGVEIAVSSISESGKVHVVVNLPLEMQSLDPQSIVVAAHMVFDDSDGFMALGSAVSVDRRTVAVDVPHKAFELVNGKLLAHLVVAEVPATRKPGSRPVDYDPNNQQLKVLNPSLLAFTHSPLSIPIEVTSRTGMREPTNSSERKMHVGVDLRVIENVTTVHAVADGYIVRLIDYSKYPTAQGNFVSILHAGGFATQYLHLANFDKTFLQKFGGSTPSGGVYVGRAPNLIPIKAGEVLGRAGRSGTTQPHLHLNVVPAGNAWNDSINQYVVFNPEPLLNGSFSQAALLSEFLFGYEGKRNKSGDTISLTVNPTKSATLTLYAKDSVFRDLGLPPDKALKVTTSNSSIATATVTAGTIALQVIKAGKVTLRVEYVDSQQVPLRAYGEVTLDISVTDTPKLDAYRNNLVRIPGTQVFMGLYEVTVGMWKEYVGANTGIKMPSPPAWGWIDSHPMVNVSWTDVMAYATWAGLRLPIRAEWMIGANGGTGSSYPWGNDWDEKKCVAYNTDFGVVSTLPVGSRPNGVSPFGLYDMVGNVWEWTLDGPGAGNKYTVGGSWQNNDPEWFKVSFNGWNVESARLPSLGFRLVLQTKTS